MDAIQIESQTDKYVISINKNLFNTDLLMELIERFQIEQMAQKIGIDESIVELGNEINKNWWQTNKHRFIKE